MNVYIIYNLGKEGCELVEDMNFWQMYSTWMELLTECFMVAKLLWFCLKALNHISYYVLTSTPQIMRLSVKNFHGFGDGCLFECKKKSWSKEWFMTCTSLVMTYSFLQKTWKLILLVLGKTPWTYLANDLSSQTQRNYPRWVTCNLDPELVEDDFY